MSGKDEAGEHFTASVDTFTGRVSYTVLNKSQIPELNSGQENEMNDIILELLESYWYDRQIKSFCQSL